MIEIGPRLFPPLDREAARRRALPQPRDLREDVPHPVAVLAPATELGERALVDAFLGCDEAIEIEGGRCGHARSVIDAVRTVTPKQARRATATCGAGRLVLDSSPSGPT